MSRRQSRSEALLAAVDFSTAARMNDSLPAL